MQVDAVELDQADDHTERRAARLRPAAPATTAFGRSGWRVARPPTRRCRWWPRRPPSPLAAGSARRQHEGSDHDRVLLAVGEHPHHPVHRPHSGSGGPHVGLVVDPGLGGVVGESGAAGGSCDEERDEDGVQPGDVRRWCTTRRTSQNSRVVMVANSTQANAIESSVSRPSYSCVVSSTGSRRSAGKAGSTCTSCRRGRSPRCRGLPSGTCRSSLQQARACWS